MTQTFDIRYYLSCDLVLFAIAAFMSTDAQGKFINVFIEKRRFLYKFAHR